MGGENSTNRPPQSSHRSNSVQTWIGVTVALGAVTAFHYLTDPHAVGSHNIYRRLYYLPIVWAAFAGGWRGGLMAAAVATLAYLPHAFFMHHHLDPAPAVDKALEMVLYFGVGGLGGLLIDRERRARRREDQRAEAQRLAEARAERLAGLVHLTRGLAHEIRNPLGGIQGAMEILAETVSEDDRRREMVAVGLKETERLAKVLDDFVEFARPRDLEPKPFEPAGLVQHVNNLLQSEAEERKLRLSNRCTAVGRVLADDEQITQVLINLVRNALQACQAGGRVEMVCRSDQADPERVVFEVHDTGAGVDPEQGDSIYDPYVTDREGGTGLGLSISTQLVRRNGGRLGHENKPEGGAVFHFGLPLVQGQP
jgi:two-component system sensor histidine kinase HydH